MYASVVARRNGTSDYRVKVIATATATTLYLTRTVNGTETVLSSQAVSGLVYTPGDVLNVRFQAEGSTTHDPAGEDLEDGHQRAVRRTPHLYGHHRVVADRRLGWFLQLPVRFGDEWPGDADRAEGGRHQAQLSSSARTETDLSPPPGGGRSVGFPAGESGAGQDAGRSAAACTSRSSV